MVTSSSSSSPVAAGRSLLDYSLITCFGLILLLLGILLFDPFNQTSIVDSSNGSRSTAWDVIIDHQQEIDNAAATTKSELAEVEKQIHDAKVILSEKQEEVEKIVDKVEDEIEDEKLTIDNGDGKNIGKTTTTEEDTQHEEEVKVKVIEAVVEKELGLDKWCATCKYRGMAFTCAERVEWMMNKYKITEDEAKESTMEYCVVGQ
jgi:hypothetical protein